MKKPLLVSSLLVTAFSLATPSMAVLELPGTLSKVSFNLTISKVVEGTVAKDNDGKPLKRNEEGAGPAFINEYELSKRGEKTADVYEFESKTVLKKYTIKNFLDDMVTLDVIESVKGWSLMRACGTALDPVMSEPEGDEDPVWLGDRVIGEELGYYLIHKDGTAKNVSHYFAFMPMAMLKDTTSEKMVTPVTEEGNAPFVYSYSAKFKRLGYLMISTGGENFLGEIGGGFIPLSVEYEDINAYMGVGVATGTEKVGTFGPDKTPIFLPGATKVDVSLGFNIDITAEQQESEEFDELDYLESLSLIEGSVNLGAGKPIEDVNTLPPAPTPEVSEDT